MNYKMIVTHAEHGILLENEVHFWTLSYDEKSAFAEVAFPSEEELLHAQVLIEVLV